MSLWSVALSLKFGEPLSGTGVGRGGSRAGESNTFPLVMLISPPLHRTLLKGDSAGHHHLVQFWGSGRVFLYWPWKGQDDHVTATRKEQGDREDKET